MFLCARSGRGKPSRRLPALLGIISAACCGGGLAEASPPVGHLSSFRSNPSSTLYVSDRNANDVVAFDGVTFKRKRTITGFVGVFGISTDTSGNLYVADNGAGVIDVFRPNEDKPFRQLKPVNSPDRIRVRADGTVYAGDNLGDIEVFPPGVTSPSQNVGASGTYGFAFDAAKDAFYGSGFLLYDALGGYVKARNAALPVEVRCPYSTTFDSSGNMLVADWCAYGTAVAIFPPQAVSPSTTFDVGSSPFEIILNTDFSLAFVGRDSPGAGVDIYKYPSLVVMSSIDSPSLHVDDVAFGPAPPDPSIPRGQGPGILNW